MSKLPRSTIARVLAERTMSSSQQDLATHVAAYLLQTRRTAELEPLLRDIMQQRQQHGIVEVIAVTAHGLTSEVRSHIEQLVKTQYKNARRVIVSERIQPDIIGGVRLELPDSQLDLSVRAKLRQLKQLTSPGRI